MRKRWCIALMLSFEYADFYWDFRYVFFDALSWVKVIAAQHKCLSKITFTKWGCLPVLMSA